MKRHHTTLPRSQRGFDPRRLLDPRPESLNVVAGRGHQALVAQLVEALHSDCRGCRFESGAGYARRVNRSGYRDRLLTESPFTGWASSAPLSAVAGTWYAGRTCDAPRKVMKQTRPPLDDEPGRVLAPAGNRLGVLNYAGDRVIRHPHDEPHRQQQAVAVGRDPAQRYRLRDLLRKVIMDS